MNKLHSVAKWIAESEVGKEVPVGFFFDMRWLPRPNHSFDRNRGWDRSSFVLIVALRSTRKLENMEMSEPVYERTMYHANGKLFNAVERIDADTTLLRSWTEDGVLILETYLNNKRQHHGPYRSWWDNGVLKEEGMFQSDKRIGKYRWFKQSGEPWSEHDYGNVL